MIQGVEIIPLKQIKDGRGKVMHMLRSDNPYFEQFGEIYFSTVFPGVVKAWKLHKKMILNYAVPYGQVKIVLYDNRDGSKTKGQIQEILLGENNYQLVKVPPMVWNGFKGISEFEAILANCASIPHDPDESERLDAFDNTIPYDWNLS